jgi:hypothetical protein
MSTKPENPPVTYAETKGEKPFDWNAFLDAAEAGEITNIEHREAERLAGDWVTCACGNQCAAIPRRAGGSPEDHELWDLGGSFALQIERQKYDRARGVLKAIEARSAALLAEKGAE